MYTLMMMTALSTSPDTAQFNGFFRDMFSRDSNSSGCQGSSCQGTTAKAANSCQGSSSNSASTSCQGSSCQGHGLFHGGVRSWFSRSNSSCNGSSCQGSSASNARSSCQGSSCHGSGNGCNGSSYASCMGSSCFGSLPMNIPYAPMGGEFSQPYSIGYASPMEMGAGCLGGGMPMGNYNYPTIPSPSVPMMPSGPPMVMPEQAIPRAVPPDSSSTYKLNDSNRATVVVKLPADAKLYAEGRPLNLTSAERKFTTPPLPGDREAVYNFRIEYAREGEQVTQSKKVTVRAGSVAVLEFNDLLSKGVNKTAELYANNEPKLGAPVMPVSNPIPVVAPTIPAPLPTPVPSPTPTILPPLGAGSVKAMPMDRAKITVKVPSGTVLFVDGKKNDRTDAVREFTTPTLTAGKLYTYVMRIERGAEKEERKIEFMAGEAHTVDFTAWPTGNQRASR